MRPEVRPFSLIFTLWFKIYLSDWDLSGYLNECGWDQVLGRHSGKPTPHEAWVPCLPGSGPKGQPAQGPAGAYTRRQATGDATPAPKPVLPEQGASGVCG